MEKKPKQFEIGELLINNGGYSVETVTGKEQIIMNGELFKVRSATPIIGPYEIPCVSLTSKTKISTCLL
jgi:hypothetical protein